MGSAVAPLGREKFPPLTLAHGEEVKKEWLVSSFKRVGWVDSMLSVTDSRVIYRARAGSFLGKSGTTREVQLQDVSGSALVTRRGLTALNVLTVLLGFVGGLVVLNIVGSIVTPFSYGRQSTTPGWLVLLYVLLVAVSIAILAVRFLSTEVAIVVFAREIGASPIALYGSHGRQEGGTMAMMTLMIFNPILTLLEWLGLADATSATNHADLESAEKMYDEFGALILDLQTRGVLGGAE